MATWHDGVAMSKYARDAVRNGYAVLFLHPGRKDPLCPLTARELAKAGPHHPCGVMHASDDEKWVYRTAQRLEKSHGRINLGIAAHRSRLVVIDADTPEQVAAVRLQLGEMGADEALYGLQPTVATPGVERDGVWVHSGARHWYFNVVEGIELPLYPGELQLAGGAVMRWGNSYTVVPPSVRPEGRYESLADQIPDLPLGLLTLVRDRTSRRTEQAMATISEYVNDGLVSWSVMTPWAELLVPQGWQFLGKLDRQCGCPVWLRPGEGQSTDRSAIAHENDCALRENREGHGSLHVFSDNVPGPIGEAVSFGQRDFTKLQFSALVDHGGDETGAQVALGLVADLTWLDSVGQGSVGQPPLSLIERPTDLQPPDQGERADSETSVGSAPDLPDIWTNTALVHMAQVDGPIDPAVLKARVTGAKAWFQKSLDADIGRDVKAQLKQKTDRTDESFAEEWLSAGDDTEATMFRRSDGKFIVPSGRVSLILGRRGSGKTWVAMVLALEALDAGLRVAYVDMEDSAGNMRARFATMGRNIDADVTSGRFRRFGANDLPTDLQSPTVLARLVERFSSYDLVIFDVLSRLVLRMGGDVSTGNTEVAGLYDGLFDPLAFGHGRTVVVLAHPNKEGSKFDTDPKWIEPAGGAMTMNSLSGVAIALGVVRPFGKDSPNGDIALWCRKGRCGWMEGERLGNLRGTLDIGQDLGNVAMALTVIAPEHTEAELTEQSIADTRRRVIEVLTTAEVPSMAKSHVGRLLSKLQQKFYDTALAELVHSGEVIEQGKHVRHKSRESHLEVVHDDDEEET